MANKRVVLPGLGIKMVPFLLRLFPRGFIAGRWSRLQLGADMPVSAKTGVNPQSAYALRASAATSFVCFAYDGREGGLPSRSLRSKRRMVEPGGSRPPTSSLRTTRSPS